MIQTWKTPPIVKGLLTRVPVLDQWRRRRATTGGSNSARYCYSVWLRHLTILASNGFRVAGAQLGLRVATANPLHTQIRVPASSHQDYDGMRTVQCSIGKQSRSLGSSNAVLPCA